MEEEFERCWERWLDDAAGWATFFGEVAECTSDLAAELARLGLVNDDDRAAVGRLRRTAEQRAVQIPGAFEATDSDLKLLALAFSRGEPGSLAVPFQVAS